MKNSQNDELTRHATANPAPQAAGEQAWHVLPLAEGFHHCRGRQEGVRRGGPRVRPLEHGRSAHPFSSTHCVA